jgi:fumarylacetoacetate (FAA) hydrolase
MKLVTYQIGNPECLGIIVDHDVYNLNTCDPLIPDNMRDFLQGGELMMGRARLIEEKIKTERVTITPEIGYKLLAPVPHPASCRDAYAFRQHVATARRNRGLPMIPEFDQFPIFYFTNHQAIYGPGYISCMPDHFNKLDFELEVAVVINKKGRNIKAAKADSHIAGYMIMNDLSARTMQMEEMLLNLGPAKGKDFATVIGPWLVTPDELELHRVEPKLGHTGHSYNLEMVCRVNGIEVSQGNLCDMDWTFAEIIERASYGCDLHPGDVIGSGTVGTGCFLELNGTGLLNDATYTPQWLYPGDGVELEVSCLGVLENTVMLENADWSLLDMKKNIKVPGH